MTGNSNALTTSSGAGVRKVVLGPAETRAIVPDATIDLWLYQYTDNATGWSLSIGTHGKPGSGNLSLGGFRIVPAARAELPGFDPAKEALGLASGMEEKVFWSRHLKVGGPLAQSNLSRIVGGKCVLLPTSGSRVGEPRDFELLRFAISCCKDFEESSSVFLTTGQDLGHGTLSDNKTSSLQFLNANFRGSVLADTSKPTAEGNYHCLIGGLRGLGVEVKGARIGILGCGNIGEHLLNRLRVDGAELIVLEASEAKRQKIAALGIEVLGIEAKEEFLKTPFVALCCNANGGTLDNRSIETLTHNETLRFICGCENLVMPDPRGVEQLRAARKILTPMEYCGMMGYLTAVEEYLSKQVNQPFSAEQLYKPAEKLNEATYRAVKRVLSADHNCTFDTALREEYR